MENEVDPKSKVLLPLTALMQFKNHQFFQFRSAAKLGTGLVLLWLELLPLIEQRKKEAQGIGAREKEEVSMRNVWTCLALISVDFVEFLLVLRQHRQSRFANVTAALFSHFHLRNAHMFFVYICIMHYFVGTLLFLRI